MSQTAIKVVKAIAGFSGILVASVVGYMYFENISFVVALYITIITVSTVGYGGLMHWPKRVLEDNRGITNNLSHFPYCLVKSYKDSTGNNCMAD